MSTPTKSTGCYEIRFTGRALGAIGAFHTITARVFAADEAAAVLALYSRWEHVHSPHVRAIESPFDFNGLVGRVQNTQPEFNAVRSLVQRLIGTMNGIAFKQSVDNARWHDDTDAPDHALYHAPADQQFPQEQRDAAILELVARHLEVLAKNEATERKVGA